MCGSSSLLHLLSAAAFAAAVQANAVIKGLVRCAVPLSCMVHPDRPAAGVEASAQPAAQTSGGQLQQLCMVADDKLFQGPFSRAVFMFDYKDSELLHLLEDTMRANNALALGLAAAPPGSSTAAAAAAAADVGRPGTGAAAAPAAGGLQPGPSSSSSRGGKAPAPGPARQPLSAADAAGCSAAGTAAAGVGDGSRSPASDCSDAESDSDVELSAADERLQAVLSRFDELQLDAPLLQVRALPAGCMLRAPA